jgi:HEPN domain-containing protein
LKGRVDVGEELLDCALELDKAYIPTRKEAERLIGYAEKSSSSVRVYFPKFSRDQFVEEIRRNAEILARA